MYRVFLMYASAILIVCSAQAADSATSPSDIYYHGNIVTVDDRLGAQQAFAVRDDRIIAVGSDAEVLALAGSGTRRVDLRGLTVIPGLSDNHDHMWNAGMYLYDGVDLIGVNTLVELQLRLRAAVSRAKPGQVVYTTTGWSVQPLPTRQMLDQISTDVPIVLIMKRRGQGFFNTAALKRLGVTRENPFYRGAKAPVDEHGEPTGEPVSYPLRVSMIDALLPPLTPARQEKILGKAMSERNALGITSIRDLSLFPESVVALERMRRANKLTVRVGMGIEFPDSGDLAAHTATLPPLKFDDHWLYFDSLSEEPWPPGVVTADEFARLAHAANRQGWRLAPHTSADSVRGGATPDEVTDAVLSAFEAADRDSPLLGKRWLVEHVFYATPEQMERMARLGVIVSTQYTAYDPPARPPMSPERMAHQIPIREFLDRKLIVIGGSDYAGPSPIELAPNNPIIPFYFYVTRRTRSGEMRTPEEIVSREQALKIFTVNAAYAAFQENHRGRIAPGLLADFVILNQDLMTVPEDKILATRPVATFVGGKKVFSDTGSRF